MLLATATAWYRTQAPARARVRYALGTPTSVRRALYAASAACACALAQPAEAQPAEAQPAEAQPAEAQPGRVDAPIRLATREGYLAIGDSVRLFYRVVGDAPDTVVVLHGGPGLHFNTIAPDLAPLATAATLIFFDQRSAGRSTIIPDTARLNARHLVADLEAVRRHFRLARLTLLGHSWGSLLAGHYAITHPERVGRMVLIASSFPAPGIGRFDPAARLDSAVDAVRRGQLAAWPTRTDSTKACWDYWLINVRGYYATPVESRRAWGDMCNVPQAAMLNPARRYPIVSVAGQDIRPALARVAAPTLVVHGLHDPMETSSARAWATALPNARLLLVGAAGHFPQVDQPAVFFPAVAAFVRGTWPAGAADPRGQVRAVAATDAAHRAGAQETTGGVATRYARAHAFVQTMTDSLAAAVGRQDWRGAAALYTPDGLFLAPGAPPARGRQAVAAFWETAYGKGLRTVELQTMEVEGDGRAMTELGKYVMRGEGGAVLDVGKYLVMWRRTGGSWRIDRDIYNSSMETRSRIEEPDYLTLPRPR